MTGSGKTYLADKLLKWSEYVVVYDLKGQINWQGYQIVTSFEELKNCQYPKIIYKPPIDEIENSESIELFFKWIYLRENTTVYVDELMSVCIDGRIPKWLVIILTRGRELNVSFYGSTQRPKRIPVSLLSEAENVYIFRLQYPDDRILVEKTFAIPSDKLSELKKRYFFYSSVSKTYQQPFILRG